ncbi:Hypothetical protein SMAX5B_000750 [Scophthalmus maximus]|uniref:Uncharacterized protein n=1 Tax=Scophthalmus maximus TaxID=52904 RepID=A0A2U9B5P8_SCOMX|nr:Hypothetical protein SMAX5B_000750 [Scophthalmus maximus]
MRSGLLAVPAAPVIFHGTLLPDERSRWGCLLDWTCIKRKGEKKGDMALFALQPLLHTALFAVIVCGAACC